MAAPTGNKTKRTADNIDDALDLERKNKQSKGVKVTKAVPEIDWETSFQAIDLDENFQKDKNITISTTPGSWQYSIVKRKPIRKWVDNTSLNSPDFEADKGDKEISHAYSENWLCGDYRAFINLMFNLFDTEGLGFLPPLAALKVWRCLVGELVPKSKQWIGIPTKICANPDNIWTIATCIFQLITRGQFWNDEKNIAVKKEKDKDLATFLSQEVLPKYKYSKDTTNLLMAALDYNPKKRPTQDAILEHCRIVIYFLEDGYFSENFRIPIGLHQEHGLVYEKLFEIVDSRSAKKTFPPHIIVITDIAKDIDDLLAMVVLKELHRLRLVILEGFIANLEPSRKRALFGRGALDAMNLPQIPMAVGTDGAVDRHQTYDYEMTDCNFIAPENTKLPKGINLLRDVFTKAKKKKQKITVLLISGLQDINEFSEKYPDLMREVTERIVLQGGYFFGHEGELAPDPASANNKFNFPAAIAFHRFMQENKLPSVVYTKVATFAVPIHSDVLLDMDKDTDHHPIAHYLLGAQVSMDVNFYKKACLPNPKDRFQPFMDQNWYLKFKSSWYDTPHAPGDPLPSPDGDEIVRYFNKVVAYDVLAAIATAGDDVLNELSILKAFNGPKPLHQIIGVQAAKETAADPKLKGSIARPACEGSLPMDGERMATVIVALLRGALLSDRQGLM